MKSLSGVEPAKVFEFFEYISSVPRGSGNTGRVADLCVKFAKDRGLTCYKDKLNNVVIYKPATPGYEAAPTVILQGHLDMVCAKNADCTLDMAKEPIKLCHDEKYVYAEGTTLGGDDGIALAYAMAVLDSKDLKHPALEAVFTIDEETGMNGAEYLDGKLLNGKILLNIDSEVEGVFTCGCAGGCRINSRLAVTRETITDNTLSGKYVSVGINISGLKGGHSGIEIDSQPASANYLLGRVLYELYKEIDFRLISLNGGEFDNVISDRASAEILIPGDKKNIIINIIEKYDRELKYEYSFSNPEIKLSCELNENNSEPIDKVSTMKVLNALYLSYQGVIEMSQELKGMVQTSQNLGIISLNKDVFLYTFLVRSSIDRQKDIAVNRIKALTELLDGNVEILCDYPGWKFKNDSLLRERCVNTYKKLYGKDPIVNTIHAGLECGFFTDKIDGLDAVSMGPDILNIHTPEEKLDIASVQRVWEFLKQLLSDMDH